MAAARGFGEGRVGRLRIDFAASLALTVLPRLLGTFRERLPKVRLDIHEMTATSLQLDALRGQSIHIGLLREPPADEAELGFKTVLTEPAVAVSPSAHPLATQRIVKVA
ncbi:LysR substrate-binding domain-containing protein [Streptomyces sp. Pv4-95]|uniref:LysR substrate-binding domain-containing protein n=1 Tax=Streptomyces sp. Pv4-95 TaxID=3049543 RepID=UPI0038925084